ncbi:hypothetical protein CEXT_240221 [Caerostris extrusa]|uniref:Uncharacterized protein n=1 Tax=Caerostris extrusa TaxID=172846 RepID=A0AAV4PWU2_CAEEX|nr:hypothetical protein CEXT_240221 [Caerostris extrusa]
MDAIRKLNQTLNIWKKGVQLESVIVCNISKSVRAGWGRDLQSIIPEQTRRENSFHFVSGSMFTSWIRRGGESADPNPTQPEPFLRGYLSRKPFLPSPPCGFKKSPPEMLDTFVGLKELRTPKHTADRLLPSHRTILHSHYCAERHRIWFLNWGL